jgi:hypothetical protein
VNIEKIENRIKEIQLFLDSNRDYSKFNHLALFKERNELTFKLNKQNIYTSLRGNDKYYKAFQCRDFADYIEKNGFNKYKSSEIDCVYFAKHSITIRLKSTGETDIKRFETPKEMFSFVQGFNVCINEIKRNQK